MVTAPPDRDPVGTPSSARAEIARGLLLALPASMILFSFVTAKTRILFDGPAVNYYGFPLPWHHWCGYSSLLRSVNVPALAFDFACYLLVVVGLTWLAGASRRAVYRSRLLFGALWASACLSVVWLVVHAILPLGNTYLPLVEDVGQVQQRSIHLGVHYPY